MEIEYFKKELYFYEITKIKLSQLLWNLGDKSR